MKTYKLVSVKGTETFTGKLAEAIHAAIEMDRRLQPVFRGHCRKRLWRHAGDDC